METGRSESSAHVHCRAYLPSEGELSRAQSASVWFTGQNEAATSWPELTPSHPQSDPFELNPLEPFIANTISKV
jgi:hypothetical protein